MHGVLVVLLITHIFPDSSGWFASRTFALWAVIDLCIIFRCQRYPKSPLFCFEGERAISLQYYGGRRSVRGLPLVSREVQTR